MALSTFPDDIPTQTGAIPTKEKDREEGVIKDERFKTMSASAGEDATLEQSLQWFRLILLKDFPELRRHHQVWTADDKLVRNEGDAPGKLALDAGNLASDFIRSLAFRLFSSPFQVHFTSDNPDMDQKASDMEVVAQSLLRTSQAHETMKECFADSMWANSGWFEVDHPMNPGSLDYLRRRDIQLASLLPNKEAKGEWAEADANAMKAAGFDPDEEYDIDPTLPPADTLEQEPPKPLYTPLHGTPYLRRVDPRLILIPPKTRTLDKAWYLGRIHFLSPKELGHIFPEKLDGAHLPYNLSGDMSTLFDEVETDRRELLRSQMCAVVEVYFKRCRLYPQLNGLRVVFLWNYPTLILSVERAPYGGLIPLFHLKPDRIKKVLDTSRVRELAHLAQAYNQMVQSIGDRANDMKNLKWLESQSLGLTTGERSKLMSPNYKGGIKVADVNGMKIHQWPIDQGLFMLLNYLRSGAQTTIGASDMDQGKAIKDITARQVEILSNATGANLESMKSEIRSTAVQAMLMIIHFASLFSHVESGQRYSHDGQDVFIDRGRPDFISSALYKIEISEDGEDLSAEDRLILTQFLRVIMTDPTGEIPKQFDKKKLARLLSSRFGISWAAVASNMQQTALPPGMPPGTPGMSEPLPPGAPLGQNVMASELDGQHPERQLGDRGGVSTANALEGLKNLGVSGI